MMSLGQSSTGCLPRTPNKASRINLWRWRISCSMFKSALPAARAAAGKAVPAGRSMGAASASLTGRVLLWRLRRHRLMCQDLDHCLAHNLCQLIFHSWATHGTDDGDHTHATDYGDSTTTDLATATTRCQWRYFPWHHRTHATD